MNRICLMVYLALLFAPWLVHAEEPVQYEIQAYFIVCPTNEVATLMTLISPNEMTATKFDPSTLPAGCKLLSSPIIITTAGQTAEIRVSEKPTQFFVKRRDGSYELQQLPAQNEPGITLTATATTGSSDETVNLKAKLKCCSILKREELPGVSLDVGVPTVATREQQFNLELKLDNWIVSFPDGFDHPGSHTADQAVLFLLRVHRVKAFDASGRPILAE